MIRSKHVFVPIEMHRLHSYWPREGKHSNVTAGASNIHVLVSRRFYRPCCENDFGVNQLYRPSPAKQSWFRHKQVTISYRPENDSFSTLGFLFLFLP